MTLALAAAFAATAFAQNPDALKQVKKAKTLADAQAVIKSNEASMSAAENAQAYNKCVDLLMPTITDANTKFQMGQEASVDKAAFYPALCSALQYAMTCDKYDQQPNDKGKVAPKFRKANADRLYSLRVHLINAGQDAYQAEKYGDAVGYLGVYTESGYAEMFQATAAENLKRQKDQAKLMGQNPDEIELDPYLGDVARMASNSAFMNKDMKNAFYYADLLAKDPARTTEAVGYMRYFVQQGVESHTDSVAALEKLEELYEKYPTDADLFADVASWYGYMGQQSKQEQLIEKELARDPNSFAAWALRGQNQMVAGQTDASQNDQAIESFKKAIASRADNPSVYVCVATCYNNKAAAADNDADIIANLKESLPYLEKARELDPDHSRTNWPYLLYRAYYNVYGENDARTKEVQAIAGM